jgi:hypothetical protein
VDRVRAWLVGALLVGLMGTGSAPAGAEPSEPAVACTMSDKRLAELSGLAADGERWYAINDGGTKSTVYVLNHSCAVEKVISGPTDPYDVEDLARSADGTFWLADTGDNNKARATIALISLTPAGKTTLYRLTYPDGAHDTEALLLGRNDVPYLITKNPLGGAGIYRPASALASPGPTPLELVGSVQLGPTDTPGGPVPGGVGSVLVTGAASTADRSAVAIRTYTDAYLWPVPDDNLVAALAKDPVHLPLPNEAQGEAIAFEPDGSLLSASEGTGQPLHRITGAANLVAPTPVAQTDDNPPPPPTPSATDQPGGKDGLPTMPALGITLVVVALLFLLMRRRRSR